MRRTPFFDPRRHAKGREEHLFVRGGRGGTRRTPFLIREGPLRTTKNTFLSAEDAEGRGEHLFYPRMHAKGRGEHLAVRGGREGARRALEACRVFFAWLRRHLMINRNWQTEVVVQTVVNEP